MHMEIICILVVMHNNKSIVSSVFVMPQVVILYGIVHDMPIYLWVSLYVSGVRDPILLNKTVSSIPHLKIMGQISDFSHLKRKGIEKCIMQGKYKYQYKENTLTMTSLFK